MIVSYDMSIGEEDFNFTYNVSPMWYYCYEEKGIREIYGLTGLQASHKLADLIKCMVRNREELVKEEPENGWGSYIGALAFVNSLLIASLENIDEVWEGD